MRIVTTKFASIAAAAAITLSNGGFRFGAGPSSAKRMGHSEPVEPGWSECAGGELDCDGGA